MKAFVFPGQGSQSNGMGSFLKDNFKIAAQTFEEADEALGFSISDIIFKGSEDELNLTENTQPALVACSTAYARVLETEFEITPGLAAGHSLGEFSALVHSGSLSLKDALMAVRARGKAMQEAVPLGEGAMLAVMGLDQEQTIAACKWAEEETQGTLSPANYNAPGQIVISGSKKTADFLVQNFNPENFGNPKRFKFIPLKVSAPFHCSLMEPAKLKMQETLGSMSFKDSKIPIVQNFDAKAHTKAEIIKSNLIEQVTGSVRWTESVQLLRELGANQAIECGPGKVLSGLMKKIDSKAFELFNINSIEDLQKLK
ncbi:MAG: ACP S-malonyltransferase [Bdellovibrionales bacterium]